MGTVRSMTGRLDPATRIQIGTRTTKAMVGRIDAYAARYGISRASAIALLLDLGLQNAGQTAADFDTDTGDIL
jgi:hypothetical protein